MDSTGNHFVGTGVSLVCHSRPARAKRSAPIGGNASGDDQSRSTFRAFLVELRQRRHAILFLFKPDVHAAHDDPVGQREVRNLKGRKQMGVLRMGHDRLFCQSNSR
jgi:hypothetical protein